MDIATLAYAMPGPLGFVETGRLVLRVRGLSYVESAVRLLETWAYALHIACDRWIQDPKTARLTRSDIEDFTNGDVKKADRVSALLLRERWAFGDGRGGPTEDWTQQIVGSVRVARHTRNAWSLLEKRGAVEFPPPPELEAPGAPDLPVGPLEESSGPDADEASPSASRSRPLGRLRAFFRHPIVIAVTAGLLVLLIWAILSDGFNEFVGSGSGSSTTKGTSPTGPQEIGGKKAHPGSGAAGLREETAGSGGASTYLNPHTLSQPGKSVGPGEVVEVACKVYAPEPPSVKPDGYWYRLASPPWNNRYYAPANSFWNGDIPGQRPYTHNTDWHVHDCSM